ncbi:MAG: 2,5-diamino-6-(ribosylamino)-4(3H)-pyrimidinone 5'-phosphate reductase [Nitrosopumilaceae archaeon]|jgi:2,5-diamino-6-(ribosylamino)-4(3H)-pyrimidinone 5'-phosphate reductase|uniref:2,5-diamino-6-(Ribosylamino)-4(3H)-pyrimidinone 5'-phosphate reductase n=1 Tax=Candidatus Nitrosomaritimum aestuariumsis TaxID=3342354 RepID=A0AC60VYY3_9ARCH|nr:2,5-diamino-6-(ribosylamino)-4(3H)-pyrimidinone 5'-phosphate reductase [Nitrosopumilaceae archaeon]
MVNYRPKIILSAAISIDGKLATTTGDSKLSSKKDLIRLHKLRSKVDAILIGKNTVKKDDPLLTVRYSKGKNPTRIILDSSGTISSNSKILQTSSEIKTIIAVCKKITKKNLEKLEKFPIDVMILGENQVNVKSLLQNLGRRKIKTVLLEGGGSINWEFIKNNLVDELFITITPYILGGTDSISLVQGKGFDTILKSTKLRLKSVRRIQNDVVLHYIKL